MKGNLLAVAALAGVLPALQKPAVPHYELLPDRPPRQRDRAGRKKPKPRRLR